MPSRRPSKLHGLFVVGLACAAAAAHGADGTLDPTFGTDGVARIGRAGTVLRAVAVRPDGRIVACGTWAGESTGSKIVVAQLLADGTPDREFGADGTRLIIAISAPAVCTGIVLQPDGRIVVSGRSLEGPPPPGWNAIRIVARLTPNGALDPTFASGTGIHVSHGGYSNALALQRDGKVLVAGYGGTFIPSIATDFQIMRLLPDGTMDVAFGNSGVAISGLAVAFDSNIAMAVAIDAEGRAVLAGTSRISGPGQSDRMAVVRFLADGQLDTSFGTNGRTMGPAESSGMGIAVQRDGALVLSGNAREFSDTIAMTMRVLDDGSIDSGFGDGGIALLRWTDGQRQWSTVGPAVAVQHDDRIVIAGSAHLVKTSGLLARLDATGRLDRTFAGGGVETIDADQVARPPAFGAVALSSGRIVAAGSAADGNGNYVGAIARFESDLIFADGF